MLIKFYFKKKVSKLVDRQAKAFPIFCLTVLLTFFCLTLHAQNITVRGKVVDNTGAPVPGASIKIKGTSNGISANVDGVFQISAPRNGTLVVSSVGFTTKEVAVSNNTNITVTLTSDARTLQDIVVVGYGSQRKIDLTGAVASVNLEAMQDAPNTNVGQLLQGTVPGLNVGLSTFAGGTPPVNIRGVTTLAGNTSVLIILDGIQYTQSLSSINPDDIASINVLKDASSTAVYGAQAANGVILITTRKGRLNQPPRIAFSTSYSTQKPTVGLRPLNRAEYLQNITEAEWTKSYLGPDYKTPNPAFNVADYVDASMIVTGSNPKQLLPNDFDWFKASTNTGRIFESNLSISGGGPQFSYLLSGGLVDQSNFIVNDKFKRKSIRADLETQLVKWWKVGLVSSGAFVNQDGAEPSMGNIIQASPLHVPFDANGILIPSPTNTLVPNPFQTYYVDDRDRNNYLFANIYTDIDFPFLKGLNYRMNFGNNYRAAARSFSSKYAASLQGQAYKNNDEYYDYTFDNILTYTHSFGKHDITATLLYGAGERDYNSTNARSEVFSRLNLSYNSLQLGTNQFVSSGGYQENLNYQMARINYKYNNRYLLTATVRRDGFSGFAENHKYGIFPTVGGGWIMTEENFMKSLKPLNFFKLRASFGESGNQTRRYSSIATVGNGLAYVYGDGGTTAFAQQVTALGNPDLKWERTLGLNIGADFELFNSRFSGTLDYYNNNVHDLLYSVSIPTITGFSSIQTNLGQLRNTGFEASLTYKILNKGNFQWTATGNFWLNRNKIIHLTGQIDPTTGKEQDLVSNNLFIGKPRYAVYDYQYNGIYQLGEPLMAGFQTGAYKIIDQNGDGKITDADKVFLGKRDPAYQFSIYNNFSYKGFSFSFFINSIQGGKDGYLGNNNPSYFLDDNGIRNNYLNGIDYWSPSNPNGMYPRNVSGARSYNEQSLNRWLDRSFVRLQDASISYNFATSPFLKKINAKSISLYVSGKNLITWTKWKGWDPEPISNDGQNNADGGLLGTRPVMRAFTLGLNITY